MSKDRPREFDPHPGDPWHPDWALAADPADEAPDGAAGAPESDESWWRSLRRKSDGGEVADVPKVYATLTRPDPVEAAPQTQPAPIAVIESQPEIVVDLRDDVRSAEFAAEMAMVDRLAEAEEAAHQESLMWQAVARARAAVEDADARPSESIASHQVDDRWAAEALAIEEARQEFEASRRRTVDEVNRVLGTPRYEPEPAAVLDEAEVAQRFATIAAQLELAESSTDARLYRKEELRMRTSLLVLDADQPWDEGGWRGPGASFGGGGVPAQINLMQISTTSGRPVPESRRRRRWPWSRDAAAAVPDSPQQQMRSVAVLEERLVSDRDEMGDETQPELFDMEVDSAGDESPFDIESAAIDEVVDADAVPADGSPDGPPIDDDDNGWADFTAEDYMHTATQEYADLAAAMEAAEAEEMPEQAALVADMPGMESNLVGLEDVVAAEGMEAAEAAPRSDLALRVGTGLALIALFFASLFYQWAIGALIVVVMVVAAGEMATVLVRQGRHPVALFAYLGTLGLLLGTWAYGLVAIPFGIAVSLLVVLLYYGLVAGRDDPLSGMTLTMLAILWVGGLAAFAMDIVTASEFRWLVGSVVVIVAVMDVAQYFVGKRFGKRPLAPVVSPKKTVAGLVGGVIAALATGYGLSFLAPFDDVTGIVLGAALAVTGPIGDLAVSVMKRTLGIKDMGTILPGHGGVLDRIDAILFSLPAAWLVYAWASLLG